MIYPSPLTTGTFLARRNRFLADVRLADGRVVVAHLANTGSMRSTNAPGSEVALSFHDDPKRKLPWTLELFRVGDCWVGVNTARPNALVAEEIAGGRVRGLAGYASLRREVRFGANSRVDLLLEDPAKGLCYVEVKNVTYREGRRALFPDAVTDRGAKHLVELREMARHGHRAVIFFLVNRADCASMGPAAGIDPRYAELLREVARDGVLPLAYRAVNTLEESRIDKELPVVLD
jgi:sugar fermentation stimulation protein A